MTDLEFSPSVIWKDPQESGGASVWPLKYWTTASPVLLLTVVTWNVRPCFLLTYLLLESKLSERRVWPILLLVKFLIPRYDDSAVQCGSEPASWNETSLTLSNILFTCSHMFIPDPKMNIFYTFDFVMLQTTSIFSLFFFAFFSPSKSTFL